MIIQNASVYCEDGIFRDMDVSVRGDRISDLVYREQDADQIIDGSGCYLIPGLIDIHMHGAVGRDYCTLADAGKRAEDVLDAITAYEASEGVTTIVPATMTLPETDLKVICQKTAAYMQKSGDGADIAGIYLEGPFISAEKAGAQNKDYILAPDAAAFDRINMAAGGMIRFLAVAPEVNGAEEMIRELNGKVRLTAAHTNADYNQAKEGFAAGISQVTHLYNAMNGMSHREPGMVGAAADEEDVMVELICDGIHIHPAVVRQTFKLFGADRIIFISDSMEAAGMPDGTYQLGGQTVIKEGRKALLEDGKTLAGSVSSLMDCLRTAVLDMHIPLETVVKCAAVNPAKAAGIYDRVGSIDSGKQADLVLIRKADFKIKSVILKGCAIH